MTRPTGSLARRGSQGMVVPLPRAATTPEAPWDAPFGWPRNANNFVASFGKVPTCPAECALFLTLLGSSELNELLIQDTREIALHQLGNTDAVNTVLTPDLPGEL